MRPQPRELVLPVLAAVCGAGVLALPAGSVIRLITAVALVLVLPGAAFRGAVLTHEKHGPERMLVALAASAIVVALAAIALDVVGVPLDSTVWVIVLVTLTMVGSAVGSLRVPSSGRSQPTLRLPRSSDALLIGASLALIVGAIVLGTKPLEAPAGTPGSFALWLEADGRQGVTAVVQSGKLRTSRYRLFVKANGREVVASPPFKLAPGDQHRVHVPPPLPAGSRVAALLYRLDQGSPQLSERAELTLAGGGPFGPVSTPPPAP